METKHCSIQINNVRNIHYLAKSIFLSSHFFFGWNKTFKHTLKSINMSFEINFSIKCRILRLKANNFVSQGTLMVKALISFS